MNIKELPGILGKLADRMQDMFDGMSEEEYAKADALSLATLQSDLYGWAEDIREEVRVEHPEFDGNRYPTEATLQAIREWPHTSFDELIEFVGEAWRYPEYWRKATGLINGDRIEASTGGDGANESLISALAENLMFWSRCWVSSRRGGHFVFEIPKKELAT